MSTTTQYAVPESEQGAPAGAVPTDPEAGPTSVPEEGDDSTLSWAGEEYEEGDETDPADAFAVFAGVDGVTAWLDRAEDGVLTGWVKEPDGTVYRYSDVDAWAIDTDSAGLTRDDDEDEVDVDVDVDEDTGDAEDDDAAADGETSAGPDGSGISSGLDFLEGMVRD